jgi:ADP-heptose:LPS heptosyltransferase
LLPAGQRYVGLAIGSREPRKNWPLERFTALARLLANRGFVPVLLTGPQEVEYRDEARRLMPQAIDAGEVMGPLDGAIAVASRLSAAVATNSGLGHLCGACGCPIVSLFGPMDPRRWIPFAPAFRFLKARDYGGEETALIPEDAVMRAVEDIVAEMDGRLQPNYGGEVDLLRQAASQLRSAQS